MHRKKLLLAGVCLLLAIIMLVSGSMAWLSKSQSADTAYTTLSDFEVTGLLSFGTTPYVGSTILAPVSFHKDTPNYIGNLKYTVRYSGSSPAYIRVRILEQWTDLSTDEVLPAGFLTYTVVADGSPTATTSDSKKPFIPAAGSSSGALAEVGKWVDNRQTDYCYYYDVPVQPKQLENTGEGTAVVVGDGTIELTLIDQAGKDDLITDVDPNSAQMGLVIEVEAVQPNRYREFWGISALPF